LPSFTDRQYTATREWRLNNDIDNILKNEVSTKKKDKKLQLNELQCLKGPPPPMEGFDLNPTPLEIPVP